LKTIIYSKRNILNISKRKTPLFPTAWYFRKLFCLRLEKTPLSVVTAFNFQYSSNSMNKKDRFLSGQQTKENVYLYRSFNLFFVIFILIRRVYRKQKKMSTGQSWGHLLGGNFGIFIPFIVLLNKEFC